MVKTIIGLAGIYLFAFFMAFTENENRKELKRKKSKLMEEKELEILKLKKGVVKNDKKRKKRKRG